MDEGGEHVGRMALQSSVSVRNAQLDALETVLASTPKLLIYTGAPPADCGTAASGTLLATLTLPADAFANAAAGAKALTGSWSGTASAGAGATPGYWRLTDNAGTAVGAQGTAAIGSGDMNFNGTITSGQTVSVSAFSVTAGNA
jgi:hypothetical protein